MTRLPPAELASYEFNIRSFHPEKEIEGHRISDWNGRLSPDSGHCMGLEWSDFKSLLSLECML